MRHSFNGAVPFQARKCDDKAAYATLYDTLQWGRAFSGTEIGYVYFGQGNKVQASMGPCLFRHGNKKEVHKVNEYC